MSEQVAAPFFVDKNGEQQKSLYHSNLSRQSSLMGKFKQKPFDSKYPREGTPGKIVYLQLHDGFDYVYQIENEAIVQTLEQVELNKVGQCEPSCMQVWRVVGLCLCKMNRTSRAR
jgi:hypothetical protein